MEELDKLEENKPLRDERGRLLPNQPSLNPNGRPKEKSLKEFAREYYMLKTPEEKIAYIENLEEKKPGFAWTMAEGNPSTENDLNVKGELKIEISEDIAKKYESNNLG